MGIVRNLEVRKILLLESVLTLVATFIGFMLSVEAGLLILSVSVVLMLMNLIFTVIVPLLLLGHFNDIGLKTVHRGCHSSEE